MATNQPKAPKLELKMLVMPALLFLSKQIDFKDPNVIQMGQVGLVTVAVLLLSIHYFVYTRANSNKSDVDIYVPPKPKSQLPFGLGPAPEPVKPEDFEKVK